MDFLSILLAIGLIALVGAHVIWPFLRQDPAFLRPTSRIAEYTADYDTVLTSIRDLDFDHRTGKISPEDYEPQRAVLTAQGVALLKRIDEARAAGSVAAAAPADDIEAAIRARRSGAPVPPPAGPAASGFCPKCGAAQQAGDKFCAKCGAALFSSTQTA